MTEATIRNGYGEGRALVATEAKAAGMVEGIATMETVLRRMGVSSSPGGVKVAAKVAELGGAE